MARQVKKCSRVTQSHAAKRAQVRHTFEPERLGFLSLAEGRASAQALEEDDEVVATVSLSTGDAIRMHNVVRVVLAGDAVAVLWDLPRCNRGHAAANAWLLLLCCGQDAATVVAGVRTWRRSARVFGPMLGAGMLAGFALAVQAAVMVPWQLSAEATIARGARPSMRPIALVLSLLCVVYVGITSLMFLRP